MNDEPLMSDQIIDHYTGCDDTKPQYCFDPEYLDDISDPLRAAEGIFNMIFFAVLFWGTLIALVWLANTYLGGG